MSMRANAMKDLKLRLKSRKRKKPYAGTVQGLTAHGLENWSRLQAGKQYVQMWG